MVITIIVILAIICLGYFIATQRSLVSLDEMCKNALSQIEVQLNSRWDAILALAKTASQYAKHESETLIEVIQRRRGEKMDDPATVNAQMGELSQVMGRLIAIGEAYPDLKAASVYQEVMNGVNKYEENVRLSRMVYNDTATKMNRMVRQWPSSIVASILHFVTKDYLKVDEEQKRSYPNMDEALKK